MMTKVFADVTYDELIIGLRNVTNGEETVRKIIAKVLSDHIYNYDNESILIHTADGINFSVSGHYSYLIRMFTEDKLYRADTEFIKIKYFSNEIEEIALIGNKSDWCDLRSAVNITLKAGEHKLIPLGVGMILPFGYEAHIVPRSSTFKTWGIIQTNHMGVIDESYCGDNDQWMMSVYATRDTEIHVNDRICQFRIMKKQPPIKFKKVLKLKEVDRGGFGSTGKQ